MKEEDPPDASSTQNPGAIQDSSKSAVPSRSASKSRSRTYFTKEGFQVTLTSGRRPEVAAILGGYQVLVRGFSHQANYAPVVRASLYSQLETGQLLRLVRIPDHPNDPLATIVYTAEGPLSNFDLGYLPAKFGPRFVQLLERGVEFETRVLEVDITDEFPKLFIEMKQTKDPTPLKRPRKPKRAD